MSKRTIKTTAFVLVVAAIGLILTIVKTSGLTAKKGANRLTVHEWGTFTSIAGKDGVALEWRPLNGSSDLPNFVHTIQQLDNGLRHGPKANLTAAVRMETPVIYFYSPNEIEVTAKVDFPKGKITEWYPQARSISTSIDWGRLKVMPGSNLTFPAAYAGNSRYYAARETDAAPLQVCATDGKPVQQEKFLFYRGVGTFDLPLTVTLENSNVLLTNSSKEPISTLMLFENRGGKLGYQFVNALQGSNRLSRPSLDKNLDSLIEELKSALVASGLFEKEAAAMIKTWRDSWFEEGLRVIYILPRATTDAVLPISIEPRPKELVRVLVGRAELITPGMEKSVRRELQLLGDPSAKTRAAAARAIRDQGRFCEPILKSILQTERDRKVRARIQRLLEAEAE